MKTQRLIARPLAALIALVLCAAFSFAQDEDDSYEMQSYADAVKNWEGWKALQARPPLTPGEQRAAERSSDSYFYPGVLRKGDCDGSFSSGRASCERSGKYGFIDRTGCFVIAPKYDFVDRFNGPWAPVFIGEKVGYIDRNGREVWTPTK